MLEIFYRKINVERHENFVARMVEKGDAKNWKNLDRRGLGL